MIVTVQVKFRARRDPFDYDMSDRPEGGPKGTSYSFEVIDEDDTKVRIKCTKETWDSLANTARDTPLTLRLTVQQMRVAPGYQVQVPPPAPAARSAAA